MIDVSVISKRVSRYFGDAPGGMFDYDDLQTALYTGIAYFFKHASIILSQKVDNQALLIGLGRIYSITDENGYIYRNPEYRIRGQEITLFNPKSAIVNYLFNMVTMTQFNNTLLRYTEGLDKSAEQSIFLFTIAQLKLQLNQPNNAEMSEAIRLACNCKQDIIRMRG